MATSADCSTLSASATTSGPIPSPPITASFIAGDAMGVPYWSLLVRFGCAVNTVQSTLGGHDQLSSRSMVRPTTAPMVDEMSSSTAGGMAESTDSTISASPPLAS